MTIDASEDTTFNIIANRFDQPLAQDPAGLTRAQAEANPRQAAIAVQQDARKVVTQDQAGVVAEHRLDQDRSVTGRIYAGTRDLDQALSIPLRPRRRPLRQEGSSTSSVATAAPDCSMRTGSARAQAACGWWPASTTTR